MLDGFGLINMNGRMYDPVIGRILSPDIVVQNPGKTQDYNRYSYCNNNPLKYTDPSGYIKYAAPFNECNAYDMSGGMLGVMPGGGGGYTYDWFSEKYTSNGDVVSYRQVYFDYILPNSVLNVSGPDAGALLTRVSDGFSLYSYNLNGRENLVLSIGDPKVVANTDGDGGYFTLNPTAGSYLYGTIAFSQSGRSNSSSNNGRIDGISFGMGIASEMYKEAARGLTTTTSTLASEIQAAKIIGTIGQVAKYTGWAGNGLCLGANYYNAVANRNNNNAEYYQARAIGSTIIVSLNLFNLAVPGLGTVLSIGAGIIDANGGFNYFYPVKH